MVMVSWPRALRLIRSIYPPIDLFEDIADPRDWDALASLESKTNPRLRDEIGQLDKVPPERRVAGPGASLVMAPFVHCSTDRPGRFTDGTYGVYSAGNSEEVALREVAHHHARAMRAVDEEPGWHSQFRMLVGALERELDDVTHDAAAHDPDSWAYSQRLGAEHRQAGSDGLLYRSVRCHEGLCAALFWPDAVAIPIQGDHYQMHWDGTRVDRVLNCTTRQEFALV
ncbi:RES family NAD+ phosphorylase [Novosphingobium sp. 1949]|uniref:RES family NAD+ phosphorylase n=1 Tax=Novosphingobium organovorum TaxID=2930092 RepID=A0ABT0BAD9_9SPHN|nr:RES family NAD+ phosphorylase [Novosphingobium organovorum]MCJ2182014.1 RES family NAD+ phosphorylase [Novosphingobium organovorum]